MSKSLRRVIAHLESLDIEFTLLETGQQAHTAEQAASEIGCLVAQIVKTIVAIGSDGNDLYTLLVPGNRQIDFGLARQVTGQDLKMAGADVVRKRTGFVIGGVSPFCHREPSVFYMDHGVLEHGVIWVAAGTPNHVAGMKADVLIELTGADLACLCQ